MRRSTRIRRSLVLGLAAAAVSSGAAAAKHMPRAELIAQCAPCHGTDGNSRLEKIPSLAGQPEFFLMNQLVLMREGVRPVEPMAALVKPLDDEEIAALAGHFAALASKKSEETVDSGLAQRGAALAGRLRCGSCHGPAFAGQEQMPRLAGQRVDYMYGAMKDLRDDRRQGADTQMSAVVYGVSDADLLALAHYAASR